MVLSLAISFVVHLCFSSYLSRRLVCFSSYSLRSAWILLVWLGVKADVARDAVVGVAALFGLVVTSVGTGGGFC